MRFLLLLSALLALAEPLRAAPRPNILLVMADDLGFETLGCYGGESYRTPHLDALAKTGLRFQNAFCTPLCSPSRVQLMTGRYGFRTGWTNLIGRGGEDAVEYFDPAREKTFGHVLKAAGYATVLAGKWQLAEFQKHPDHVRECGFDEYLCWAWMIDGKRTERYWDPVLWKNGQIAHAEGRYGEDLFADFIIDFMRRHREEPFFVYYPMALVHDPHDPTPDSASVAGGSSAGKKARRKGGASEQEIFADMVAYMDKTVGRLVAALDELGLRENTVIIFTGDNGTNRKIASRWNGQEVKGAKGNMTEFGFHVPFIVNWKGTTPAGKVPTELIDFSDVLPTLVELAGAKLPAGVLMDGRSFAPKLRGKTGRPREWIFTQLGDKRAARDKRYLLHNDGRLYDVVADPFERNDLSATKDKQALAAKKRLQKVLEKMQ